MILDEGGLAHERSDVGDGPADLATIVESTFVLRDYAGPRSTSWRIVPDASAHLLVLLGERETARAVLVGARSTFADIDVSGRSRTIGVRLRPGALAAIARVRADELTDRAVPLADVFGARWSPVERRLDPGEPALVIAELFAFLRALPRGARTSMTADATLRASTVAGAAAACGMPLRTFHARVREAVGLTPKRLMRIARLSRALVLARRPYGWASIAAHAGFSDQAHLARECRDLLGASPTEWLARRCPADSFKTPASS